jgi:hypothetical protein
MAMVRLSTTRDAAAPFIARYISLPLHVGCSLILAPHPVAAVGRSIFLLRACFPQQCSAALAKIRHIPLRSKGKASGTCMPRKCL